MDEAKQHLPEALGKVVQAIFDAVEKISLMLRTTLPDEAGTTNTFGDKQLAADVISDGIVFEALRESGAVATASSEETTDQKHLGGSGYSCSFDPLDGSSIVDANWAVGSIFGVWPGDKLLGRRGRDQSLAAFALYGPRTTLVLAKPRHVEGDPPGALQVQEYLLGASGWRLTQQDVHIADKKIFAPANLRCATDNAAYSDLVQSWMSDKFTLRYSGGMVPDVNHILSKGGGIFCSPASTSAPPKLRLLYECAPVAFVIEAAGGASHDGRGSVLDQIVVAADQRTVFCVGSPKLVQASIASLQGGSTV